MTMSERDVDIAIVGAGIAGLALACALSNAGFTVTVLEAGARPAPPTTEAGLAGWDRRVSALTPTTTAFLDSLDAWQSLLDQRVGPYTGMHVWDAEGTGQIDFDAQEAGESYLGHIVENRLTVAALLGVAERSSSVDCHWQTTVVALEADATGQPRVVADDGRQWRAGLVVGADGARSRLRDLAGFEVRQWSYGQRAIVATVSLDDSHQHCCWQAFLPTGPLALLPLADAQKCSIVWSLDEQACDRWAESSDGAFVAGLNQVVRSRGLAVDGVGPRAVFPLQQSHAVDYIQPRIALVADAAHSIHPLAGQGINLGLSDVRVLSEVLAQARRTGLDPGSELVLRRYQRRRKGENLAMMGAMEAFKRGFGSETPLLRVARNAGLDWVNQMAPLKQWFVRQALS